MHLALLDWLIVAAMLGVLVALAVASNRHTKSVADYLAGGRAAGRYMMTMASGWADENAVEWAIWEKYVLKNCYAPWYLVCFLTPDQAKERSSHEIIRRIRRSVQVQLV